MEKIIRKVIYEDNSNITVKTVISFSNLFWFNLVLILLTSWWFFLNYFPSNNSNGSLQHQGCQSLSHVCNMVVTLFSLEEISMETEGIKKTFTLKKSSIFYITVELWILRFLWHQDILLFISPVLWVSCNTLSLSRHILLVDCL